MTFFCTAVSKRKEIAHQPAVDGDALLRSVSCSSGSLQSLRTSQVHKVELGCQCFKLINLRVVR